MFKGFLETLKKAGGSAWCWNFIFLAVLLLPTRDAAAAGTNSVSEYEVKAAYVYYFAKFIDRPDEALHDPASPIVIGVLGDNRFASMLENVVKGKTIQNRPIVINSLKWPADLSNFDILYISSDEQQRTSQIISTLKNTPILTVTEAGQNSRSKGLINLLVEGGKVHFEVDLVGAAKANLKISSKLLRLANATSE
jgi:hypothetical protein